MDSAAKSACGDELEADHVLPLACKSWNDGKYDFSIRNTKPKSIDCSHHSIFFRHCRGVPFPSPCSLESPLRGESATLCSLKGVRFMTLNLASDIPTHARLHEVKSLLSLLYWIAKCSIGDSLELLITDVRRKCASQGRDNPAGMIQTGQVVFIA